MEDEYKYFKIEASEILEELTKGLLQLEKRLEDQELIQDLFRYAHTLKGAMRLFGNTSAFVWAESLETMGRSGDLSHARATLVDLEKATGKLLLVLKGFLA